MKTQNQPLQFGKQWIVFNKMMMLFKSGKTGIYVHPDFVMMDWKSYRDLTTKKLEIWIDEAQSEDREENEKERSL